MIEESFISSRRPSPLGGRKPTKGDLAEFANDNPDAIDDVLPERPGELSMLIVGINPGLWTAAVNAPFARPGNRFWPSLHQAGLTDHLVDASLGLAAEDEAALLARGIGITNLVGRATARADELDKQELRDGAARLVRRLDVIRPRVVAVAGITSFRIGYLQPKAHLGKQDTSLIDGWPEEIALHVVPQPSGLNAHYQVPDLARIWRGVWESIKD
ncbi:mismatch-specific DNA-glycosylase [Brevibacterium antiquum]|uniref:G/U mismatch-specific uracil-DNA glycosylase n=1 Tax=Brevibacterium antiquum TaxID=234835 RepID=A0A2H1IVD6_9MICO|nr:mismatch-specific DNA-glycosylase [Brevibacterium antiquum]SMX79145.1 G/U mismatch-specific uracil-DNA glycosylase [Brevibacterium antiquum]